MTLVEMHTLVAERVTCSARPSSPTLRGPTSASLRRPPRTAFDAEAGRLLAALSTLTFPESAREGACAYRAPRPRRPSGRRCGGRRTHVFRNKTLFSINAQTLACG